MAPDRRTGRQDRAEGPAKIVFMGDVNGIEKVPQSLADNLVS